MSIDNLKNKIKVTITIEQRNFFVAKIDSFPYGVITCPNRTDRDIKADIRESVEHTLETMKKCQIQIPDEFENEYEFDYTFSTEALLNYYSRIFSKSTISRITGINENQLWFYSAGLKKPRKEQIERINKGLNNFGRELTLDTA
ncbi:hypothetical protein FACS1894145_2620 [Bacteroidia bacterium]|nr:hypothetical protein FACS1894145_2620 [Bacteroidia bacterium]